MPSGVLLGKLRDFDAYPKTLEDFRVKTYSGAAGLFIINNHNNAHLFSY